MNAIVRLVALSTLVTACSGGGNTQSDASTEGGSKDSGLKDSGVKDTGGGQDAGTDAPTVTVDPACTVQADAGSGGSCIAITGDGGVECNPVTNAPCAAGEACDFSQTGFHCYAPPPANSAVACATCDDTNGPACIGTETCAPTTTGNSCARFCCVDGDCGSGHCDKTTLGTDPVGICVK